MLRKKSWAGQEVGKMLIASLLNDIEAYKTGGHIKPLFSKEDLDRMQQGINSAEGNVAYNLYIDLNSGITSTFNRCQDFWNQFYHAYDLLYDKLTQAINGEYAQRMASKEPLIVTRKQYKRLTEKADGKLKAQKASYYDVFFEVLFCFLYSDYPECTKAANIARELDRLDKVPAEEISFSKTYNEEAGEGYYQLPDGRRSDQMTEEEWKAAIREDPEKLGLTSLEAVYELERKLFYKGAAAIKEFAYKKTGKELSGTHKGIELAFKQATSKTTPYSAPSNPDVAIIRDALGMVGEIQFHVYRDLPKGLTAYGMLNVIVEKATEEKTGKRAFFKEFREAYPALYKAINAYIVNTYPAAKLHPSQRYKAMFTYGDLAEARIMGYCELTIASNEQIVDAWREENPEKKQSHRSSAISILQSPIYGYTDENGDYIEQENPAQLFNFLKEIREDKDKAYEIMDLAGAISNAMKYLYASNTLMGILGKVYDLPDLPKVASFSVEELEEQMAEYDRNLYFFFDSIAGTSDEAKEKMETLRRVFSPLREIKLKPYQEYIDDLTKELTRLGYTREARDRLQLFDRLIIELMDSVGGR